MRQVKTAIPAASIVRARQAEDLRVEMVYVKWLMARTAATVQPTVQGKRTERSPEDIAAAEMHHAPMHVAHPTALPAAQCRPQLRRAAAGTVPAIPLRQVLVVLTAPERSPGGEFIPVGPCANRTLDRPLFQFTVQNSSRHL